MALQYSAGTLRNYLVFVTKLNASAPEPRLN